MPHLRAGHSPGLRHLGRLRRRRAPHPAPPVAASADLTSRRPARTGRRPDKLVIVVIVVIAAAIAAGARNLIENSLGGLSYARVLANLASGLILAIGIIAALDQMHIAAAVVNAILYAVLAALVGMAIVAVGGGGIKTKSQRWEAVAARYDEEKPRIAGTVRSAPALAGDTRQYLGDREQPYGDRRPSAPGTVTRPDAERPDDRRY